jgi:hypothetical protein
MLKRKARHHIFVQARKQISSRVMQKNTMQGYLICKDWKGPDQSLTMHHGCNKEEAGARNSIHRLHAHWHIAPVRTNWHIVWQVIAPISWPELVVFWFCALRPSNVAPWIIQMRPSSVCRIRIGVAFHRAWAWQVTMCRRAPTNCGHMRTGTAVAPCIYCWWLKRLRWSIARWMRCD